MNRYAWREEIKKLSAFLVDFMKVYQKHGILSEAIIEAENHDEGLICDGGNLRFWRISVRIAYI